MTLEWFIFVYEITAADGFSKTLPFGVWTLSCDENLESISLKKNNV